ncbi:penicillin-binding protein 2 [Streptosporangiaceae bacterium NEAU-GS5]|nr:penicillin-binding protein 2 [Streptosporangiaceae bacterium NEAU-GS5]
MREGGGRSAGPGRGGRPPKGPGAGSGIGPGTGPTQSAGPGGTAGRGGSPRRGTGPGPGAGPVSGGASGRGTSGRPATSAGGPAGGRAGSAAGGSSSGRPGASPGGTAGGGTGGRPPGGKPPARPPARPPGRTPARAPVRPPARPPAVLRLGNPRRRLNAALVVMAFVLSLFAGRLVQLQGLDSKVLQAKAAQQRVLLESLPARRGTITDVKGHPLAITDEAREIYLDPADVTPARRDQIATTLAKELTLPKEQIAGMLAKTDKHYLVVVRDLDPMRAKKIMSYGFKGVGSKPTYRRTYPGGNLAGGLIGFVGTEGRGLTGLERAYDKVLAGQDGQQSIEIGRDGQRIPMTRSTRQSPVSGRSVRLTIDRDVQWAAQEAIDKQVRATRARSGSVIVMDIRTGQIVAMANSPEVDLNHWDDYAPSDWGNRAAAEVFEPGSTNKVITAAAAIESGAVTPETRFTVADHIRCADRVLRDAHTHKTEPMTFTQVIGESSNVGTIMAAQRITSQRLYDMFRAFGFGATSGGRLPGEEEGLLPKWETWSGSQRCTIAYGQGISVTALQVASVYQTIANGGVRITPTIVAGATDEHGRMIAAPAPAQTRVVSATTAQEITGMLEGAVEDQGGTGSEAAITGYRVAGKTGTAMRYDQKCMGYCGYTATFVGFTPAQAPRLVALAVIQDPKNGHFGGMVAAPVFKDVMTFALKTRKIPPDGS